MRLRPRTPLGELTTLLQNPRGLGTGTPPPHSLPLDGFCVAILDAFSDSTLGAFNSYGANYYVSADGRCKSAPRVSLPDDFKYMSRPRN